MHSHFIRTRVKHQRRVILYKVDPVLLLGQKHRKLPGGGEKLLVRFLRLLCTSIKHGRKPLTGLPI